ncbi:hypothetical protein Q3G72_035455 [Acer saccharum]|nr:hypothetical protein Q3G72_035455 [Acer saccharum]
MVASTNWSFCVFLAQAAITSLELAMFVGTHSPSFILSLLRMFCLRLNFYMHRDETRFARINTKLDSYAKFPMVFMARDFDFYRGRYAHFSVRWSDQKSIRDLVSSILQEPPNIAQIELGYEPYMLGKPWMSSF